ncbi:Uncharacterized protein PHSC3_001169 [Chlamydiales bacterium STE3]|nr:Uncharacterized protein PHSC3_001169 [Chlamydiales bacterium STE3]
MLKKILLFFLLAHSLQGSQQSSQMLRGTENNPIPNIKFQLTPREVKENSAVSILGEGGRRNFRLNGTMGLLLDQKKRFKLSGEFLQQRLRYRYTLGKANRWVRQFATGATFQQDFSHPYITHGTFSGHYSYTLSRYLGHVKCKNFIYTRRIAGSSAYGFTVGSTVRLGELARLTLDVNYDAVIYYKRFHSNNYAKGFGGSLGFHQKLFRYFDVDIKAEFKRPYNYYRASISWAHPNIHGLSIGVYGAHTKGKSKLPNNTTAGFELSYVFHDLQLHPSISGCRAKSLCRPELASWLNQPSVYLPEVLAMGEEKKCRRVRQRSALPSSSQATSIALPSDILSGDGLYTLAIPSISIDASGPFSYDISPYFINPLSANSLVFSATGLPPGSRIDALTGMISGINLRNGESYLVHVVADNGCSSAQQSFTMIFSCSSLTSYQIPDVVIPVSDRVGYAFDTARYFSNECGSAFIFSASGLPPESTISPVSGIISGVSTASDVSYFITVTARAVCGQTSQTFKLCFDH